MNSWKTVLSNVLCVTLPTLLGILLLAEFIVFRHVIPACQRPAYDYNPEFHLVHLQPNTRGTFTAGTVAQVRAQWRINNCGWNSGIDYENGAGNRKPVLAIIGDSYIEGLHVNLPEALPAMIRRQLGDRFEVYSFGVSGAPLSQYLHLARYVNRVFKPAILVVLVVHNDFDESLADAYRKPRFLQLTYRNGTFAEVKPTPYYVSSFTKFFHKSALVRYLEQNCELYSLLNFNYAFADPLRFNANIDVEKANQQRRLITKATRHLIDTFAAENTDKKLIFMMDAPRVDIYEKTLAVSNVAWLHQILRDACGERHLDFLDLTQPFAQEYYASGKRLDNKVDAHWNARGHRLAADTLLARLREITGLTGRTPPNL